MTSEESIRDWLKENCPHLWSFLDSQARRRLPSGLLEYLSPPSEEQLDEILPWNVPPLPPPNLSIAQERQQHAEDHIRWGRERLKEADEHIQRIIDVFGERAVHAYRSDLSHVGHEDQLAQYLCEIAVCAKVSVLFPTPTPQLRPPSGRPGSETQCDLMFQVEGIRVYGEVKRLPDPWLFALSTLVCLRKQAFPRQPREEHRPIDLYRKLQDVPKQFPACQVNLLFVLHRSRMGQEEEEEKKTLEQALFGWHEDRPRPAKPDSEPTAEAGLFAREDWRDVSGCCFCRVTGSEVRFLHIWENPRANVPLPPQVYSALSRAAV